MERVPSGVRWRIRRARIADSYEVGILRLERVEGGLLKMYCDEGRMVEVATGRIERIKGNCILAIVLLESNRVAESTAGK